MRRRRFSSNNAGSGSDQQRRQEPITPPPSYPALSTGDRAGAHELHPLCPAKIHIQQAPGVGHRTQRGHTVCHQPGKSQRGPGCSQCPPDSRALTPEPRAGGGLGIAALPGVLALGDSADPGGAGMLVPGMGTARTGLAAQAGWFAAPSCPAPMDKISSIPVRAWLSPSQEGSCCPTPQRCARRTRRRTSLLLYTNRAGIRTQCCPRQEGGRQTEREGDIREALRANCCSTEENRLQQQHNSWGEASKAQHPTALPAVTPPYGRGVPAAPCASPVSQKLPQPVSLPRPKAGVQFGDRHRRSLLHKCCH